MNRDLTKWAPYVHAIPKVDGRIIYLPKSKKELAIIHIADAKNVLLRLYFQSVMSEMNNK